MKFGGTSVGDVAAFERFFNVVSSQLTKRPVVVVSAMTKVTDALLAAFDTAKKGDAEATARIEKTWSERPQPRMTIIAGAGEGGGGGIQ